MQPLDSKALERAVFDFWAKNKIYEKAKATRKGKQPWAFIDGPPYATGSIHMGTAWNKIIKDAYLRFWRMRGRDVWDQPGYDTHGLPIENKVEQELGLRSKKDIERFGVAKFVQECKNFATRYIDVMNKQFANLGVWMDWKNPYLTLTNQYIEGAWYTFAQAFKKGLLYKSIFPVHVCTRCVDPNSTVLVKAGTKKLSELKNCWRHNKAIAFDPMKGRLHEESFSGYMEYPNNEVLKIRTMSGREIVATRDHPFWTKAGWRNLENLSLGDEVAVYHHPEMMQEDCDDKVILSSQDIQKNIEKLEIKSGLLPKAKYIDKLTTRTRNDLCESVHKLKELGYSYREITSRLERIFGVRVSKSWVARVTKQDIWNRESYVLAELQKRGLMPLTTKSQALPVIARLLGHIFGDGCVAHRKPKGGRRFPQLTLIFTGKPDDLERIATDLRELGFAPSPIRDHITVSKIGKRTVRGTSTEFRVESGPLTLLLITLGAPIGEKSINDYRLPRWILNSPDRIVREFLAAFFGSELDIIKTRRNGKGFEELRFHVHKKAGFESSGLEFINQLYALLKRFGIKTRSQFRMRMRVNGKRTYKLTGRVASSDENIRAFCEKIGYVYCSDREVRAAHALAYLRLKHAKEAELIEKKSLIKKLRKDGLSCSRISKRLHLPELFVRHVVYGNAKRTLASKHVSTFEKWSEEAIVRNDLGVVWEPISEIKPMGKQLVADVTVENLHSFVVNGFVTHNCETVLAYNEIEYTKLTDPSVYVQFKVKGKQNEYLVIWTTTPWTLPGNTAIMAHPDFDYARVQVGGVTLIIAKDLVEAVMKQTAATSWKILETFKGRALEGLEYEHPLRDLVPALKGVKHRVVLSPRFVTLEQGTGLVHVAPGHGFEDYLVGKEKGLPSISPLDIRGTFTEEAGSWLSGKYAKAADSEIIEKLREKGAILHLDKITHDYPQCWRCDTPLLQLSIPEWFFRVEGMRNRLIAENKRVNWVPPFAGERFNNWLQSLGDWPVSRQRYWGIPLPIWEDDKGHIEVVGSFEELKKKAALKSEIDFHKPQIDEVKIKCGKCGAQMSRVPEVLDVWFDSGAATWASLGYPRDKKLFQRLWPFEFQAEGPDQIRGWWNSQMIMSLFTFGRAPFKNVLYHGFVLDLHGVKMSKSRPETLVTPEQVIEKYGRDVLRFYLLSFDPWDDFAWNWDDVADIFKVYTVWWNTFQFVKTYVENIAVKRPKELLPEDRWILSRLNSLLALADISMQKYHAQKFVQAAREFILQDFSRTYIKLIRDRVAVGYAGKDRAAAEWTLVEVLRKLDAAMAPIAPFITEDIHQQLLKKIEKAASVHLLDYPQADKKVINATHEQHMSKALEVIEAINAARAEAKVRARWPLRAAVVVGLKDIVGELGPTIAKLTNVKETSGDEKRIGKGWVRKKAAGTDVYLDTTRDEGLIEEAMVRELIRKVQTMRKTAGKKVTEKIALSLKAAAAEEKVLAAWKAGIEKGTTSKLAVGKLAGAHKDRLEFEGKVVEISF